MTCPTCGGLPWECECAQIDAVVSHTSEGYPLNSDGFVVMAKCTAAQRHAINEKTIPNYQLHLRQAQ